MKILVLGGTGYLGTNIVRALSECGHKLTCIVRPSSNYGRISVIPDVRLISSDISEIEAEISTNSYDWVINSVCTYRQNESLYLDMMEANFIFPVKVLNLAAKHHVPNFMTMGTTLPGSFNMYSFTKFKLSETGKYFSEHEGLINFVELRLEMFYGSYPGGTDEPEGRFIRSSILKLCRNEPLLLTAGTQKRDVVHVEDIAGIVQKVIHADFRGYRVRPVGTGEQHSIREIMEFLHMVINSRSRLEFGAVPSRAGEPNTLADTSWYAELGYKLKHTFWGGLEAECLKVMQNSLGVITQ